MQVSEKSETPPVVLDDLQSNADRAMQHEGTKEEAVGAPTADEENGTDNNGFRCYLRLWSYSSASDKGLQAIGFLAACAAGTTHPLMTLVFGNLVNDFNGRGTGTVSPAQLVTAVDENALWFIYLFIAKFLLVYVHTVIFTITATRITRNLRLAYVRATIRQDITYFDSCTPGSVATNISNNANMIQNGLSERVGIASQALAMLVSAFIIAFLKSWKLTLVTASSIPVLMAGTGLTIAMDAKLEGKVLAIYSQAGGLVEEALGSIRNVIAFAAADKFIKKYDHYLDAAKRYGVKKGPILGAQYSVDYFVLLCAYALAFWYGSRLVLHGEIANGGTVATVILCINQGTTALMMLSPSIGEFTKAAAAAKSVLAMISRKPLIDSTGTGGVVPEALSGKIELSAVSFSYPARPMINVLNGVDLVIEEGKTTAIVGSSGSGKSTIVGLIERWYDAKDGVVSLDGRDVRELNVRWLRSRIGLVQQEPVLFSDTIYENVAYGLHGTDLAELPEEAKRELVRNACIKANIDTFIRSLPDGYDTAVGERAGRLSGGQKQRIAIARGIISDPKILLLDEATSALDPNSEALVQAALDKVSKSRTTIIIAHKLSTVKNADKIVILNKGRIVEEGTHESLLESEGAYFRLVNAQNLDAPEDDQASDEEIESEFATNDPDEWHKEDIIVADQIHGTPVIKPHEVDPSRKMSLLRCLAIILKEHRKLWIWFLCGILAALVAGAVYPAQAVLFAKMITVFQLEGKSLNDKSSFWSLMFFVLALGTMFSYAALGFSFTVAASIITRCYRADYFSAMLRQDMSFFDFEQNSSGSLTARLSTDPQNLQDLISATLGLILVIIVDLVSSAILALIVGWKIALVAIFGSLPLIVLAGFLRMKMEMKSQDRNAKLYLESARFASEAVGAIRTVSSLTLESEICERYAQRLSLPVARSYRHTYLTMLLFALSDSIYLIGMGLAFWYGGRKQATGEYNAQQFFIVFTAIVSGGQAAGMFFGFTNNITKAQSAINHILHLRDTKPIINHSSGKRFPISATPNIIEFKDVHFQYEVRPDIPVLQGLNIQVPLGQSIALVGPSGCGKSTVIALLERFYDVTSGEILINGEPLRLLDVNEYRSIVSLVSQEATLYQGSIRDNILIGISGDIAEERFVKACKDANIHDFILSLPEGYNTQCGLRGLALSGGQRQRIAIARALIRDPMILLLDEATSALDTESEKIVQEALDNAAKGRTTISVAHRLSTVKTANQIFVINHGKVDEAGTHGELLRKKGRYWDMCQAQSLDRATT